MQAYLWVLVLKLIAAFGFVGGVVGAFVADSNDRRKHAVHWVASPCLLATWSLGFGLLVMRRLPLFELWVVGALALSAASHLGTVACVSRGMRSMVAVTLCTSPLALTLGLMVFKPLWTHVMP